MNKKYFIVGIYSNIDYPTECFRPCELYFDNFQSCVDWIESHKKYFVSCVHFGVFSVDNKLNYARSENKNL